MHVNSGELFVLNDRMITKSDFNMFTVMHGALCQSMGRRQQKKGNTNHGKYGSENGLTAIVLTSSKFN